MPRAALSPAMPAPVSASPVEGVAPASASTPASYEDALKELERLVVLMEDAALPLDRMLESYRRAAELLTFCRARLAAVEDQVKVLEDGQLKAWMPNA